MAKRAPEEMKQRYRTQSVRTVSADDVAQMVVTYCRVDTMTGQTVVVDGGALS